MYEIIFFYTLTLTSFNDQTYPTHMTYEYEKPKNQTKNKIQTKI